MDLKELDIPSQITEEITLGLSKIGIDVPMGLTQGFMLILCLVAIIYGIKKLRKDGAKNLVAVLVVVGFGLYSLGITYSWTNIYLNPLPGELEGSVKIVSNNDDFDDSKFLAMRIELLDLKGENAGLTFGAVDSRNGRFIVKYIPSFFDYPRSIRIHTPGCKTVDVKLKRLSLYYSTQEANIPVLPPVAFECEQIA